MCSKKQKKLESQPHKHKMDSYRFLFFDLETTGISPERDKIIELAVYDLEKMSHFSALINPQRDIPEEATRIHHISNEMVQDAPSFAEVGKGFVEFCQGNVALIAHNGSNFDFPFLDRECTNANVKLPEKWLFIDSLLWARKYRKDLPRHALQYLREAFQIPPNQAHRALDDVMVLKEVFMRMVGDLSPEQVIELIGYEKLSSQLTQTPAEEHLLLFS